MLAAVKTLPVQIPAMHCFGAALAFAMATPAAWPSPLAMGVLGDSDSQGYQNRIWFPPGGTERGGAWHASTLQWTEVLAALRGDVIDLGPRGVWGAPRLVLRALDPLGYRGSRPRTEDHRHNFAMSGASCLALASRAYRQSQRLLDLMDDSPDRWRDGIIVIRAGGNDFGTADSLDALARNAADDAVAARIDDCLAEYRRVADAILARHPQTRLLIVGTSNNAHWPPHHGRWQSQADLLRIEHGLDRFDASLRTWAATDRRIAFFDDRAWFRNLWGDRDQNGRPTYRPVRLGSLVVTNTQGDAPNHAVLADGHAGLVWNLLWAQALVHTINAAFGTQVPDIRQDELTDLLARLIPADRLELVAR